MCAFSSFIVETFIVFLKVSVIKNYLYSFGKQMCPFSSITLVIFNEGIQISNLSLHCKFYNYQIIKKTYIYIYIYIYRILLTRFEKFIKKI